MGYCHSCGTWAELVASATCAACRRDWQPAGEPAAADLGCHGPPQPLGVGARLPDVGRLLGTVAGQHLEHQAIIRRSAGIADPDDPAAYREPEQAVGHLPELQVGLRWIKDIGIAARFRDIEVPHVIINRAGPAVQRTAGEQHGTAHASSLGAAVSFGSGPEWARDTGCCGKPAGCTCTGPACLMRGHPGNGDTRCLLPALKGGDYPARARKTTRHAPAYAAAGRAAPAWFSRHWRPCVSCLSP